MHPSIADVLHVRPFLFLWASQILSQIAFNMLNFVLVLRVYQLTQSNTAVSVLVFFFLFPQLLLSLFAGVFVDRFEKKIVMLLTNIGRALALVPLLLFAESIGVLYAGAFAVSVITQFFLPAELPMIPQLLTKKLLLPANSLFTMTLYGSIVVGYILAGPSLKFLGITTTLFSIALLFAAASVCNSLLPGKNGSAYLREQVSRFLRVTYTRLLNVFFNDIGEVLFAILRTKQILLGVVFLTLSQVAILVFGTLLPGYTATILAVDAEDSSFLLLAPAAFGMIAGSFFVLHVGRVKRKGELIVPGVLVSGILFLLLPIVSRLKTESLDLLFVAALVSFLLGVFNAMIIIPANILIQEHSKEAIRGRIYGLFNALSALISIVPVVLAGYFSDIIGVGRVVTAVGISIIALGILSLFWARRDL